LTCICANGSIRKDRPTASVCRAAARKIKLTSFDFIVWFPFGIQAQNTTPGSINASLSPKPPILQTRVPQASSLPHGRQHMVGITSFLESQRPLISTEVNIGGAGHHSDMIGGMMKR
jgi:hypothetical protein